MLLTKNRCVMIDFVFRKVNFGLVVTSDDRVVEWKYYVGILLLILSDV